MVLEGGEEHWETTFKEQRTSLEKQFFFMLQGRLHKDRMGYGCKLAPAVTPT